jgi:uncharacterized protein
MSQEPDPIAATRAWVDHAVIGLNLCPFAKAVQAKGQVRYVLSPALDEATLQADLVAELHRLAAAPPALIDTTLLVHPGVFQDFLDFNDFLGVADATVEAMGLGGVIQIASFHPRYQFAGNAADDITNHSNRSPHPTLHLLRESSIDAAVAAFPDAADIYERNIATLQRLGQDGWRRVTTAIEAQACDGAAPGPSKGAKR